MGVLAPLVMSATTFAGSAQFAVSSILGAGGGAAAAIAAAVLLNARYAPISISVAPLFHGRRLRRLAESQLIVDESWAFASRGGGRFDRRILLGAGLLLYVSWVSGTAVGVLAGHALGDPKDSAWTAPSRALPGAARAAAADATRRDRGGDGRSDRARADPGDAGRNADRRRQRGVPARPAQERREHRLARRARRRARDRRLQGDGACASRPQGLPPTIADVVALLAPVLLAALVVTQTVGGDNELVLDARLAESAPVSSR